jgi:hypothetical protein
MSRKKGDIKSKNLPEGFGDLTQVIINRDKNWVGLLQYTCDFTESSSVIIEEDQQLPLFKILAEHLGYEVSDE